MKKKNIYSRILDYFRKQAAKLEGEVNGINDRLNENRGGKDGLREYFNSSQESYIESAEGDSMHMYKLLDRKIQLHKNMLELIRELETVYKNKTDNKNIDFGCIFSLQNGKKKPEYFLLAEGDDEINIDNTEMWICSRNSLMGRTCAGRSKGDSVKINKLEYKVKDIF